MSIRVVGEDRAFGNFIGVRNSVEATLIDYHAIAFRGRKTEKQLPELMVVFLLCIRI
jgi:hypothetical protein